MKITSNDIIAQGERLAAAFPWDYTEIDAKRSPSGDYQFMAYIPRNDKFGFDSVVAFGNTPEEAVNMACAEASKRDPKAMRDSKIAELQKQIDSLQKVTIGMPPYRPGSLIANNGEGVLEIKEPINV